jgi:hypothetical protein
MKKKIFTLLALLFVTTLSFGQFYKSLLPSPEFTSALEKIVLDFRDDYKSIQGNLVDGHGEMETYESLVCLPGSVNCKILRFHSLQDTTATWQAIVYNGEDYKEAVKAYENTFRLVKKSSLRWIDKSSVGFTGQLERPREELRFTTSTLVFTLDDYRYKDFQAEVEIQNTFDGWQVTLNLSKKYIAEGVKRD